MLLDKDFWAMPTRIVKACPEEAFADFMQTKSAKKRYDIGYSIII